jgi:hypothetical protein
MKQFGCLIVGFRRSAELIQVMNKVKDEGFDRVFISIDGTLELSEETVQQNFFARKVVREFIHGSALSWELIFREVRFGIVKNFTASIDRAFEEVDYLCILEDDCVPAGGFLSYFKNALDSEYTDRVKMFTFFRPDSRLISQGSFATHNPLMWGWGLSKKNWAVIKEGISPKSNLQGLARINSLPFQSFYFSGYSRAVSGKSDALDALISYFLLMNDYLVIGPPRNLISNIGYGPLATNTKSKSRFLGSDTSNWDANEHLFAADLTPFSILKNDFAIAREMNKWKFHHLLSNYLKIKFKGRTSKLFSD